MEPFVRADEHGIWMRFADYALPDGTPGPRVTLLPEHHQHEHGFAREKFHEYWRHDHVFREGPDVPGMLIYAVLS